MERASAFRNARRVGTAVSGFVLAMMINGCDGDSKQSTPPASSPESTSTPVATLRPTETAPRPLGTATATATPRFTATPSSLGRVLHFDDNDGLQIESHDILLTRNFRIEAKVKLDKGYEGFGETLMSKGDDFAIYARSLKCLGNLGALFGGEDICTGRFLEANTWHFVEVRFDGQLVIFYVGGQEVYRKPWQGPLGLNRRDIILGRRPGILRQPMKGSVDDIRVYDEDKLVTALDFEEKGTGDISPFNRRTQIIGNATLAPR